MRKLLFGMFGLLVALATLFLGMAIGAAGHGWIEPFFLSLFALILYPLAVIRAFCVTKPWSSFAGGLLIVVAVTLDALMFGSLILQSDILWKQWNMFPDERWVPLLWFALWAGWQLLFVVAWTREPQKDSWPS